VLVELVPQLLGAGTGEGRGVLEQALGITYQGVKFGNHGVLGVAQVALVFVAIDGGCAVLAIGLAGCAGGGTGIRVERVDRGGRVGLVHGVSPSSCCRACLWFELRRATRVQPVFPSGWY